jgi:hypothetical protein
MTTNLSIAFLQIAILLHLQESKSPFGESITNLHVLLSCRDGIWIEKVALQVQLDELITNNLVVQGNFLYKLKNKSIIVKIGINE